MTARRQWVIATGTRYWPTRCSSVAALPMPDRIMQPPAHRFTLISLPDWAEELGVGGQILVDSAMLADGEGPSWLRCDWLGAAFLQLTSAFERSIEDRRGPIHSYACCMGRYDSRLFEHAWTNRIFLFLRRWAARNAEQSEREAFGPLPAPEIRLTHDVDALRKTFELSLKQSAFHAFNVARLLARVDVAGAGRTLVKAGRFAFQPARFDTFALIRDLEDRAGIRSLFHFYGGPSGWRRGSPKRLLFDPAYNSLSLRKEIGILHQGGWAIGLHQSFDAWQDPDAMRSQRALIEQAAGTTITACRQHWLRFSLERTWQAQEAAGLTHDSTLGFNDRPGFRNAAALTFNPWNESTSRSMALAATPMVLMDSHLYDYQLMTADHRFDTTARWLGEIRAVHGQATVNWHTHTITDMYGWGEGYRALLSLL